MSLRGGGLSNEGNGISDAGRANGVYRSQRNKKKANGVTNGKSKGRHCPVCGHEFTKRKSLIDKKLGKSVPSCPFPECGTPLHINAKTGEVFVLYDKLCVDNIIEIINKHKSRVTQCNFDLGAATARERKFGYEMIEWAERFMNGAALDIGMDVYEFVERFLRWILTTSNFYSRLPDFSLVQIRTTRGDLAVRFYEEHAQQWQIELPNDEALGKTLKRLAAMF